MNEIHDAILQSEFTTEEQQIFLRNFRCYLEYDPKRDFVIELDKVFEYSAKPEMLHPEKKMKLL